MIRLLLMMLVILIAGLVYAVLTIRTMERKLREKAAAEPDPLQEQDEEQRRSVIRHDLKGMLNRVFALSKLIPMSGSVNEAQQEYLQKIEEQCAEGTATIDRMFPRKPNP